jgi:hypothetical protein
MGMFAHLSRRLSLVISVVLLASCGYGELTFEDLEREGLTEGDATVSADGSPVAEASASDTPVSVAGESAALGDFEMGGYACTLIPRVSR